MHHPGATPVRNKSRGRLWLLAAALIGTVVLGAVAWEEWLEDRLIAKRWGVVEEGRIYRSGQISAALVRSMLERHDIGVIVQLSGDDPNDRDQMAEHQAVKELGISLYRCPLIGDGQGDPASYVAALRAIVEAEKTGRPVLVHCHAGSQRTGGVIALYRVLFGGWSPEQAVAEMEDFGWRRNRDQVLLEYLDRNLPAIRAELVKSGTLQQSANASNWSGVFRM